jgi:8-oxo-dGTP pyrophosphatase MutT (NUDIX family)
MPNQIHLTVATLCHRDGQLLMVEEKVNGNLVINQPAGHVEAGESLKSAALRETLEETGYLVLLESFLGISVLRAENEITYYRVSFLASCPDQLPSSNLDPDIERAIWMHPDDILDKHNLRSELVSLDVKRFLSGTRYPLEMIEEKP